MKNAFYKDFFRSVWHTRSRFFAIVAIVALGAGFFAGLEAAAPDMRSTVDEYLDEYQTMDLRVISPLGLVDDDIRAIKQVDGVSGVMPAYSVDATINLTGKDEVVRVHSLPKQSADSADSINQVTLTAGRMPQAENECLFYADKLDIPGKNIGDTVILQDNDAVSKALSCKEYTIVGLVNTPYYLSFSLGSTSTGSGTLGYYMYIPQNNFIAECYTEAFVTVEGAAALSSFSPEYQDAVERVADRISEIAPLQLEKRRDALCADQLTELEDAKKKYEEGRKQAENEFSAAEQKLKDAQTEIDANEEKLNAAQEQLDQGAEKLAEAQQKLAALRREYAVAQSKAAAQQKTVAALQQEWDTLAKTYAEHKAAANTRLLPKQTAWLQAQVLLSQTGVQLQSTTAQIRTTEETILQLENRISELKKQIAAETDPVASAQLEVQRMQAESSLSAAKISLSALRQTQQTLTALQATQKQAVQTAKQEYDDAKRQVDASLENEKKQLDVVGETLSAAKNTESDLNANASGLASQISMMDSALATSQKTLADSRKEFESGKAQLEDGKIELTAGRSELESKKSETQHQLDEAQMKIADGEAQLEEITKTSWYVLNRDTNVGIASFKGDADRMASIADVFPVIFFLVAALVALTTMTRMIEEERSLIGTYRALGFSKRKITARYMIYAALATFLGSVIGVLLLQKALPTICWTCYRILYAAPAADVPYQWNYALGGTIAACACTLVATFSACRATVSESPAQLMQPRAPKPGKRILLERIPFIWNHMGFIQKVTARNLFRYKKRLIMTVVGIAGCTGLLLTGFGIKDSVSSIITNQYDDICQYDMQMTLRQDTLLDSTRKVLEDPSKFTNYLEVSRRSEELTMNGITMTAYISVPKESEKFPEFIALCSRVGHNPVQFGDDSVVITEKLANRLGLSVGDSITLKNDSNEEASFTITGITENYISHYIYISRNLYEQKLGEVTFNEIDAICASADPAQRDAICEELIGRSDVSTAVSIKEFSAQFDTMIQSLNYIILIIIVCAGLLAFIVLYNLTNINVSERQREIATIKVLGFYDREVGAYVYRETAVLTAIGCLCGLLFGVVLHRFVITTVEVDMVMFGRTIAPMSFVWSALITAAFAVIVNLVMYKKLQSISMVESLKSVD